MQEQTVKYINIICSILITFFLMISVSIYYFPNLASKYFILSQITINGSEKSNINIIKNEVYNHTSDLLSLDLRFINLNIGGDIQMCFLVILHAGHCVYIPGGYVSVENGCLDK